MTSDTTTQESTSDGLPYDRLTLVVGIAFAVATVVTMRAIDYTMVRSDAVQYYVWSQHFWTIESTNHLPFFPFCVWVFRQLTFGLVPAHYLMPVVNMVAWTVSFVVVGRGLSKETGDRRASVLGAVLFALFPVAGVTFSGVVPLSDATALATVAVAFFAFAHRRWPMFAIAVALGLVAHKGVWPYALLLSLAALRRGYPVWMIGASGTLLVAWFIHGYLQYGTLSWLFTHNVDRHLKTIEGYPVLDAILGSFSRGGVKDIGKGLFYLGLLGASGYLTWVFGRERRWEMLAFTLPLLGLAIVLNARVGWAMVRFAKLIAIPAAIYIASRPDLLDRMSKAWSRYAIIGTLVVTQVFGIYYIYGVYHSPTSGHFIPW